MKKFYLITYEFSDNDDINHNVDNLARFESRLNKIGLCNHMFKQVYLFKTENEKEDAKWLFNELHYYFGEYDRLFITEMNLQNTFGISFESVWYWLEIRKKEEPNNEEQKE